MLKIKDNVDLKELEKYGYTKHNCNNFLRMIEKDKKITACFVYVSTNIDPIVVTIPRVLYIGTPLSFSFIDESYEWVINDLIKANLVEKVED